MESLSEDLKDSSESSKNTGFDNLGLNDNLIKGVYIYGFKNPSKIQVDGIKAINTGKDCILQSQSGTGKTATYLLGILNRMEEEEKILKEQIRRGIGKKEVKNELYPNKHW